MNNEDYEFQETLMSLGEYRTTALVLTYMRNHGLVKSAEIEHETGLRQPEVSISMRELIERGWIKKSNGKTSGKGRPYNVYMLTMSMDEIITWYQAQANLKAEEQRQTIQKLKETVR